MGAYFCPEPSSSTSFVREKSSITDNPTAVGSFYESVSSPRSLPTPMEEKKHTLEDFVIKGMLGEGGFASVYVVELKSNVKRGIKKEFAMKKIGKRKLKQRKVIENIKTERMVYAFIKNNFVISLNYAFQDKSFCYFVMEYAQGGDVYSLINNQKQPAKSRMYRLLGEEGARFILACVVLGLECVHSHNIIYRDLKPQNVLIFKNGYIKLTDFGLAKELKSDQISQTMAGTKIYYAPQILEKKGHNKAVDFWTLGVFLHQLILLMPPFDGFAIVPGKFTNLCLRAEQKRDWKNQKVSPEAKNLINSFLRVKPDERLGMNGFQEIKNHPFFSGLDWQALNQMKLESPLLQIATSFPVKPKLAQSLKPQHIKDNDKNNTGFIIQGLSFNPQILKQQTNL